MQSYPEPTPRTVPAPLNYLEAATDSAVELHRIKGEPVPREVAILDLRAAFIRAHSDSPRYRRRFPGRPHWRRRWGWTDHQVRSLLKLERLYHCVDIRQPTASPPPAHRQPVASPSPVRRQTEDEGTPEIVGESPARRQPVASPPPAVRQDSASESPRASNYEKEKEKEKEKEIDPVDETVDAIAERLFAYGHIGQRVKRTGRSKKRWASIRARLVETAKDCGSMEQAASDMLCVFRWARESSHSRAAFLRGGPPVAIDESVPVGDRAEGHNQCTVFDYGFSTIVGATKFSEYLELARAWDASGGDPDPVRDAYDRQSSRPPSAPTFFDDDPFGEDVF